jgi:hypothetical protein
VARLLSLSIAAGLAVAACAPPLAPDRDGICAARGPTCGGPAWERWCRSACIPDEARQRPCDVGDPCVFCADDDGTTLYTWARECVATPALCQDDHTCPSGQRVWTTGGACLPSDPCADDTSCRARGRVCIADDGLVTCGRCIDDGEDVGGECMPAAVPHVGPFRVSRDHFTVWDGTRYRALFLRGVNVGGARPGEYSSESSLTEAHWLEWMTLWADAGLNVVRVYHVHPPPLYDAVVSWNTAHPTQPIYLLQGIYYPETEPGMDPDIFAGGAAFDTAVADDIDRLHGTRDGYPDVSPWTIGWLIGRELFPDEVMLSDSEHPSFTSYTGTALSIDHATPTAAWAVERLDHAITWERSRHHVERPVAWSLWPVLDPLTHPTERREPGGDVVSVDFATVDASAAPAGHFISYHAYPYDPDFLSEDAELLSNADSLGRNSYRGYLRALRTHYQAQAFLVAEFGLPTSYAATHGSGSGMPQGGLDETQQGVFAARMLENIEDIGAAGGIYFQWEDGWWKHNWASARRALPYDHLRVWHNLLDPESNFGFISFEPGMSEPIALPLRNASSHVVSVRAASSAAVVHFEISLDAPLAVGELLEIGFDVLDRTRGEPQLPSGLALRDTRPEIAMVIQDEATRLEISGCIDTNRFYDDSFSTARTLVGGCGWGPARSMMARDHIRPPASCWVPRQFFDLSAPRTRLASAPARTHDVVVLDGATIRIDVPWNLLLVADPSSRSVLDDDPRIDGVDVTVTDGIALSVAVRGELVETEPYAWQSWDGAPPTTERIKDGAETFFAYTRGLPQWLD